MKWLKPNQKLRPHLDDMACAVSSTVFGEPPMAGQRDLLQQLTNAERIERWRERLAYAVLRGEITEDEITANLKRAARLRVARVVLKHDNIVPLREAAP